MDRKPTEKKSQKSDCSSVRNTARKSLPKSPEKMDSGSSSSNQGKKQTEESGSNKSASCSIPTPIVESSSVRCTRQRQKEIDSSLRSTRQGRGSSDSSTSSTRQGRGSSDSSTRSTRQGRGSSDSSTRSTRQGRGSSDSSTRSTRLGRGSSDSSTSSTRQGRGSRDSSTSSTRQGRGGRGSSASSRGRRGRGASASSRSQGRVGRASSTSSTRQGPGGTVSSASSRTMDSKPTEKKPEKSIRNTARKSLRKSPERMDTGSSSSNQGKKQTKESGSNQSASSSIPAPIVETSSVRCTRQRQKEIDSSTSSTRQGRGGRDSSKSSRGRRGRGSSASSRSQGPGGTGSSASARTMGSKTTEENPQKSPIRNTAQKSLRRSRSRGRKGRGSSAVSTRHEQADIGSSGVPTCQRKGASPTVSPPGEFKKPLVPSESLGIGKARKPVAKSERRTRSQVSSEDPNQPGPSGTQSARRSDDTGVAPADDPDPKTFSDLDLDTRLIIFKLLLIRDLLACCQVCRTWNEIFSRDVPWLELCRDNNLAYTANSGRTPKAFVVRMNYVLEGIADQSIFKVRKRAKLAERMRSIIEVSYAFHYRNKICAEVISCGIVRICSFASPELLRIFDIRGMHGLDDSNIAHLRLTYVESKRYVVAVTEAGSASLWDVDGPLKGGDANRSDDIDENNTSYGSDELEPKVLLAHDALVYVRTLESDVNSFDVLEDTLIGAFGLDGYVRIWVLNGLPYIDVTTSKGEDILQVVLTRHWSAICASGGSSDQNIASDKKPPQKSSSSQLDLLLFCMDFHHVYVYRVLFDPHGSPGSSTLMHVLSFDPEVADYGLFGHFIPAFCYDGLQYLYFQKEAPSSKTIVKFDVRNGIKVEEYETDFRVDNLLGAGSTTLLCAFWNFGMRNAMVVAIDTRLVLRSYKTLALLAGYSALIGSARYSKYSFIGERSWLNGFDGENDSGVVCSYIRNRTRVNHLYFITRV